MRVPIILCDIVYGRAPERTALVFKIFDEDFYNEILDDNHFNIEKFCY